MYSLLVVDDEKIITDGIISTIDWGRVGFRTVSSAANGIEAMLKIEKHIPDIVITDIKMDQMDGLTFIDKAHRDFPFIKFIVMSGYNDPDLIRRSLELNVFSYLLKPVGEEELLSVVMTLLAEINKEAALREKIRMIDREINRNKRLFIESFFDDLLNGKIENQDDLKERTDFLRITFQAYCYRCVLFSVIDSRRLTAEEGFHKLQSVYLSIEEAVKDIWQGEVWPVHIRQDKPVIILGADRADCRPEEMLDNLQKFIDVPITAAVGDPCDHIIDIWKSFNQALIAHESNSTIRLAGFISMKEIPEADGNRLIYPAEKETKLLVYCFNDGSDQDITDIIKSLFDSMERQGCSVDRMRIEMMGFLTLFSRKITDAGLDVQAVYQCGQTELYTVLAALSNRDDLETWVKNRILTAKQMLKTRRTSHIGDKIRKARYYLSQHYHKSDLSLDSVADYLGISSSYLSRVFKKETGQSFVDVLTAIRMEKAVGLISSTTRKMTEIAAEVGYQNARYFWEIFRKYYGCSPSEYRETHFPKPER